MKEPESRQTPTEAAKALRDMQRPEALATPICSPVHPCCMEIGTAENGNQVICTLPNHHIGTHCAMTPDGRTVHTWANSKTHPPEGSG